MCEQVSIIKYNHTRLFATRFFCDMVKQQRNDILHVHVLVHGNTQTLHQSEEDFPFSGNDRPGHARPVGICR